MHTLFIKRTLCAITLLALFGIATSCSSNEKKETPAHTNDVAKIEAIPDTIIDFLITSAATDFRAQQSKPSDFRNLKMGYILSATKEKTFILCGEFLSATDKIWTPFTTIKTSGYEQYIGKSTYCQDATLVLTDAGLVDALKKKLAE